jgi:hypothetical protein
VLRRHLRLVVTIAAVGVAVLVGVLIWHWATPPALPHDASPETVARTYFELDAAGRSWAAMHYVSHSGRPDIPKAGDTEGVASSVSARRSQTASRATAPGTTRSYSSAASRSTTIVRARTKPAIRPATIQLWLTSGARRLAVRGECSTSAMGSERRGAARAAAAGLANKHVEQSGPEAMMRFRAGRAASSCATRWVNGGGMPHEPHGPSFWQ